MKFGSDHQGRDGVLVEKGDMAGVLGWRLALASTANPGGLQVPRQGVSAARTGMVIVWQVLQAARAEIQPAGARCPTEDAGRRQHPCHGLVQEPMPLDGAAAVALLKKLGVVHGLSSGESLVLVGIDQAAASEGTAAVKPVETEPLNLHL